ncbi:hypothetical protein SUNI508_12460 [Seiridium unicorne]|uniref:Uncharacterized protein n=1 Tax=Seiridium unicorne TaxID=138068 RepID=A0ABR2UDQ1_9PEZI
MRPAGRPILPEAFRVSAEAGASLADHDGKQTQQSFTNPSSSAASISDVTKVDDVPFGVLQTSNRSVLSRRRQCSDNALPGGRVLQSCHHPSSTTFDSQVRSSGAHELQVQLQPSWKLSKSEARSPTSSIPRNFSASSPITSPIHASDAPVVK